MPTTLWDCEYLLPSGNLQRGNGLTFLNTEPRSAGTRSLYSGQVALFNQINLSSCKAQGDVQKYIFTEFCTYINFLKQILFMIMLSQ